MKNIVLIFLSFLLSFTSFAQYGYNEGTTWHYGFISDELFPNIFYMPQSLVIEGDTIIEGESFKRIVKNINSHNWDLQTPFSVEYIRKEEGKVFWFNQQSGDISILYDFTAEPGDNWTISINHCELLVVVDSVNYSEYNGIIKKNIYVNDYFTNIEGRKYVGCCFKGKIIEDIGHNVTFFPHRAFFLCDGIEIDGILPNNIRCYEDHSFSYNFKGYACDTTWNKLVGIIDYEGINIKIYPNPVKDLLIIETSDGTDIVITDIVGKVIAEKRNIVSKTYLDVSKWKTGIYFICIYSSGTKIKTEKLIKI